MSTTSFSFHLLNILLFGLFLFYYIFVFRGFQFALFLLDCFRSFLNFSYVHSVIFIQKQKRNTLQFVCIVNFVVGDDDNNVLPQLSRSEFVSKLRTLISTHYKHFFPFRSQLRRDFLCMFAYVHTALSMPLKIWMENTNTNATSPFDVGKKSEE